MTGDVGESSVSARARASWLCPLIAWASQILLALTIRGIPGLVPVWLLAMCVQIVLILAGVYLGAKVLSMGRSSMTSATWLSALVGVGLSGGTILLIVCMFLFAS